MGPTVSAPYYSYTPAPELPRHNAPRFGASLLGQPGGFKGVVSAPVELAPGRLTVIDLHHQVVDVFDVKPACPPGGSDLDQNPGEVAAAESLADHLFTALS